MIKSKNKIIISLLVLFSFILIKPISLLSNDLDNGVSETNYNLQSAFGDDSILDKTAQEGGYRVLPRQEGETQFFFVIATLIYRILEILGVIFVILIIFSGARWMTALGNEEQVTKAKNSIKQNLIGLFIVVASWGFWALILTIINQF